VVRPVLVRGLVQAVPALPLPGRSAAGLPRGLLRQHSHGDCSPHVQGVSELAAKLNLWLPLFRVAEVTPPYSSK
jgi:hypothetical protein